MEHRGHQRLLVQLEHGGPVHKVASAREIVGELLLTEHVLRHKPLVVGILDEAQRQAVFTVDLWIEKVQFFDTTLYR